MQAWATTQKTTVDMVDQEAVVAPVNLEDEGEPLEQDEEVRELLVESVEKTGYGPSWDSSLQVETVEEEGPGNWT